MIDNLKRSIYIKNLNSSLKKVKGIERGMIDFNSVKKIGILFDANHTHSTMIVSKFAEKLRHQGKDVEILGFQNIKSKEEPLEYIFNLNDTNWTYIPKSNKVQNFQNKKFDVLINAFLEENLPLEYISALSKAKFRVGVFNKSKTYCSELMISTNGNSELQYLLDQMVHFLKVIKND